MYAHFYHLAETPFNLTPDPKFHYVNESTREALASILHGLKARKGFLTLIGEAGTGKTTLLKRLVDEIEGTTQVVFVFNPGVSFDELLEFICSELGVTVDGRRRLHMLERLNEYLLEQLTGGRNVVVMIDEAQTLSDGVLEELRLLSNLETSKEKILQILLAGQPELEEKLRRPGLRQLRQRVAVRATLRAMGAGEIAAYVETRLKSAGSARDDLFTQAALHRIWRVSKGIPRVVNVICDNAMMIAFAEGKKRISYRVAAEAVRDLEGAGRVSAFVAAVKQMFARPWLRYASAMVVVVVLLLPALRWFSGGPVSEPDEQRRAVSSADVGAASGVRQPRTAMLGAQSRDTVSRVVPGATPAVGKTAAPEAQALPDDAVALDAVADSNLTAEAVAALPDVDKDAATKRAPGELLAPVTESEALKASIRRAQIIARSTAARLYHDADTIVEAAETEKSLTEKPLPSIASKAEAKSMPKPASARADAVPLVRPESKIAESGRTPVMARLAAAAAPVPAELEVAAERQLDRDDAARRDDTAERPAGVQKKTSKAVPSTASREPSEAQAVKALTPLEKTDTPAAKSSGAEHADRERRKQGRQAETVAVARAVAPVSDGSREDDDARTREVSEASLLRLGRLVEVRRGDTVWDIAIAHYGTAGPKTLKRILVANPGMVDPRKLEVGTRVYLPFVKPEQMVEGAGDGTFRLILASAPDLASMAAVKSWVMRLEPLANLRTEQVSSLGDVYRLLATGISTRQAARELAGRLLAAQEKRGEQQGQSTAGRKRPSTPSS